MRRIGRRQLAVVFVAGALAVVSSLVWQARVARRDLLAEPRVDSAPLSIWLATNRVQGRDPGAEAALAQAGGQSVPALIRVAERGLSPLEVRFYRFWLGLSHSTRQATVSWIRFNPKSTMQAMDLLGYLGPEASNSVPALLRIAKINQERTGSSALSALLKIAPQNPDVRAAELAWLGSDSSLAAGYFREAHRTFPEALPILLQRISAAPTNAINELNALSSYGPAASNALPSLRIGLKAGNANALFVVLGMGPPAAPVAEELAAQLGNSEEMDLKILDGLSRIGRGAAPALPSLNTYLTATNPVTRLLAEATVASLRGDPTAVLPSFQHALEKPRPFGTRHSVSFPLLGAESAFNLDPLTYNLEPRQLACWLAGEMGPDAAPILPSLEANLTSENAVLRVFAAWAHWRIAHRAGPVLPVLQALLREPNSKARRLAICALIEIGPPAAAAEPELRAIMKSDLATRRLVNLALAEIHRVNQP